jgi:hypothetical protein
MGYVVDMAPKRKTSNVCSKDTDFYGIINGLELSPVTKTMYCDRIRHLCNSLKVDFFTVLKDYKTSIAWIEKHYEQATSRKAYLSIALSMFRHCDGLKDQLSAAYKAWFDAFSRVDKEVEERYKRNEPSEKQAAGYVAFVDLEKKRDSLKKGCEERLLLGFYTWIYPLRADFNCVKLYDGSTVPSSHEKNYIHIGSKKGCTLVLSEYKTSSTHGVFRKLLPEPLCEEIHASLEAHPREWLFVQSNGKPFEKSNSYIRYANRILGRLFEKPLTLSLIRHAFIDTLDFNTLTIAEKEEIALEMRHTTRLQDQYRLIFRKAKESSEEK